MALFIVISCNKSGQKEEESKQSIVDSLVPKLNTEDSVDISDEMEIHEEEKHVKRSSSIFRFRQKKFNYPKNYFRFPFDSAVLLSGSFGELRSNHFHAGLDIRTGGVQGWEVKAAGGGYVSRIKVSRSGYGKALYIAHPNGYTTVYGHLKEFKGAIADYVEKQQYKNKNYEIEAYPKAGELKVSKSDIVALSGNTGGSGGPHLHFEIRSSGSGETINPLHFGLKLKDNIKPRFNGVIVYQYDPKTKTQKGNHPYKLFNRNKIVAGATKMNLPPGDYAFGTHITDFGIDRLNKLGVNYVWATANGKLLYEHQIDKLRFDQGRYINAHIDYYIKATLGVTYIRLFKENNPLSFYKLNNNGILKAKQGESYEIKIYSKDFIGQLDSVKVNLEIDTSYSGIAFAGKGQSGQSKFMSRSKKNSYTAKDFALDIPAGALYHNLNFYYKNLGGLHNSIGSVHQLHYSWVPLHKYMRASIKIPEWFKGDPSKLVAASWNSYGKRPIYEGGSVSNGKVHFKTRSFGQYYITQDVKGPTIKPISYSRNLKFRVNDNLSGVKHFTCSIDDQWVLLEYEPKSSLLFGRIPDWVKPGKHELKLVVKDDRNNQTTITKTITI